MPVISALRSLRQEDPDLSFDASENLKTIYKGKKKKQRHNYAQNLPVRWP